MWKRLEKAVTCPRYCGFPGSSMVKNLTASAGDTISPGGKDEGQNGILLQYSYLKNPMDWGAWWAVTECVYAHVHIHTQAYTRTYCPRSQTWECLTFSVPLLLHWACKSFDLTGMKISFWNKKKERKLPFGHTSRPVGSLVPLPGIESRHLAMQECLPLDHQGIDKFSS